MRGVAGVVVVETEWVEAAEHGRVEGRADFGRCQVLAAMTPMVSSWFESIVALGRTRG